MYGFSVLEKIRKDHKDYKTTVIMIIAVSDEKDVKNCLKCGIQGYIVKPFDSKTLARKILDTITATKQKPLPPDSVFYTPFLFLFMMMQTINITIKTVIKSQRKGRCRYSLQSR
jgi:DNA-binding response OmpR family regulator